MKLNPSVDPGPVRSEPSAESLADSIELLWRCRTLAQKGRLLLTHTEVLGTQASPVTVTASAAAAARDDQLVGAEITIGTALIGHVEGLVRDPLSQRVRGLITSYGLKRRRVAVPMEWVTKRSDSGVILGVGVRSLDDLSDRAPA